MSDYMSRQCLADARSLDCPAAQGNDSPACESLERNALFDRPEGRLAFALEEDVQRLAELGLDDAIGVDWLDSEGAAGRPRRPGLAGAHEADECDRWVRRDAHGRR